MRITACGLAALALLLATPSLTTAQERQGFWIGVGVGVGSAAVRCDKCNEVRDAGAELNFRLGGTVNERLLIGGEINVFGTSAFLEEDLATILLYSALGTVTFYPKASSGFFLKGGAGLSGADIQVDYVGSYLTIQIGNGLGLLGGAGYDLRVGRRISVTPAVNFLSSRLGNAELSGDAFKNWKHNVVDFTVGITFH